MYLSKLISGNTPFITNLPVYLATVASGLRKGAFVVGGATGSAGSMTISVVTTASVAANCAGVLNIGNKEGYDDPADGQDDATSAKSFRIQSDYIADRTWSAGNDWLPTIVNSDALYMALYSTTTAAATVSDTITENITASTGTYITVTGEPDGQNVGGFIYSHDTDSTGAATTYSKSLRFNGNVIDSSSIGLLTAMNISTDSSLIRSTTPGHKLTIIDTSARFLRSAGGTSGIGLVLQLIATMDNYGVHDQAPMHPLRQWVDDGLDALSNFKMYGKVLFMNSYWQNSA